MSTGELQPEPGQIPKWEPAFPKGVDVGFQRDLLARHPRAWVTMVLFWANIIPFVAMTFTGVDPWISKVEDVTKWGANDGLLTLGGQWWRVLTGAFAHNGSRHLAFNMLVLWFTGFFIERLVGSAEFLVAYLAAAVCGSVATLVWNPYSVAAGASGAIFGIYGLLLAYLVRNGNAIPTPMTKRLLRSVAIFIGLNVLLAFTLPGIGLAAHLGGLLAGFAAGIAFSNRLRSSAAAGMRMARLLVVAFATIVVTSVALRAIPTPVDLVAERKEFYHMQREVLTSYDLALVRWRRSTLSDADFARTIEDRVLPPWRRHGEILRLARRAGGAQGTWVKVALKYVDLRDRYWSKVAEAVHTGRAATMEEALALNHQADAIAHQTALGSW